MTPEAHERQKSVVLRLEFAAIPDLNPSGDCEAREAVQKQCETVQELGKELLSNVVFGESCSGDDFGWNCSGV